MDIMQLIVTLPPITITRLQGYKARITAQTRSSDPLRHTRVETLRNQIYGYLDALLDSDIITQRERMKLCIYYTA